MKYNSVTSIAFTVQHNHPEGDDITDAMLLNALLLRIADCVNVGEIMEACGNDLSDTQENEV